MSDPLTRLNAALEGSGVNRRVLVLIGTVLLPLGCGGDPPAGPDFAALAVTTTTLPDAAVTLVYSETLAATGGDESDYTWSVTVGSLPVGLSLTASSGTITGAPSVGGTNTFTVEVVSADGQIATQALTITVAPSCSVQPDSAIPTFEDANLEAIIRVRLSVSPEVDLTCRLLETMTILKAEDKGITSLVGIENLTNLTDLFMRNNSGNPNSITDLSPLSGMTTLHFLHLSSNPITDISALSGLTNLIELTLSGGSITDISPLSGLTNLTWLWLTTDSSDISVLSGLTRLTRLSLGSSISDISVLSGLTRLTILSLGGNITDISALSGLTGLTYLNLAGNSITDVSALSELWRLWTLILSNNSITDISALSGLGQLREIDLGGNPITDFSPLCGLPHLDLSRNSVSCEG